MLQGYLLGYFWHVVLHGEGRRVVHSAHRSTRQKARALADSSLNTPGKSQVTFTNRRDKQNIAPVTKDVSAATDAISDAHAPFKASFKGQFKVEIKAEIMPEPEAMLEARVKAAFDAMFERVEARIDEIDAKNGRRWWGVSSLDASAHAQLDRSLPKTGTTKPDLMPVLLAIHKLIIL
ncbi:hypothetical protein CspHIS471_0403240 [Cutaneotrichosporon sp. HIS471]|nr:hypothetical protein CspHIS471_0403240 [Cutaneotrichosporon sp. HIS471]